MPSRTARHGVECLLLGGLLTLPPARRPQRHPEPRRGFYRTGEIDITDSDTPNYAKFYNTYRQTIGYERVDIGNYVNSDHLPATLISTMKKNLAAVRGTGLKMSSLHVRQGRTRRDQGANSSMPPQGIPGSSDVIATSRPVYK
jgi:hypothetical protein